MAGGMGFAVLSGHPEIGIPLVLAAETAYLGLLGTHPKFQDYVNAQDAKKRRGAVAETGQQTLEKITRALPKHSLERYEKLQKRCRRLGKIASNLKEPTAFDTSSSLESMQTRGLDRLLWVYLRLLFAQHTLDEFKEAVSEESMKDDLEQIEERLKRLGSEDQSPNAIKIRRTLTDNQATINERLENYAQAKSNSLFVMLELERVENKIKSISELSVNRQDPEYISGQIDAVANSMKETERTMNDLHFGVGLGALEDDTPELMNGDLEQIHRSR